MAEQHGIKHDSYRCHNQSAQQGDDGRCGRVAHRREEARRENVQPVHQEGEGTETGSNISNLQHIVHVFRQVGIEKQGNDAPCPEEDDAEEGQSQHPVCLQSHIERFTDAAEAAGAIVEREDGNDAVGQADKQLHAQIQQVVDRGECRHARCPPQLHHRPVEQQHGNAC